MHWTIYCHTHNESGRRYVGLTRLTMMKRWNSHVYTANRTEDGNPAITGHFPNAIRKYGKDAFSHDILGVFDTVEEANAAEEYWIDLYGTRNPLRGFNLTKGGAHTPHPIKNPWDRPEYRVKATEASRKRWQDPVFRANHAAVMAPLYSSPEYLEKMSKTLTELSNTPEGKAQRMASAHPGKVLSEEHRNKIKASSRSRDLEVRAKISAAVKAAWADPETREKMSAAQRGLTTSPETCAKRSALGKGRIFSSETKAKIAESLRNAPRKTHCKEGHSLDDAIIRKNGKRRCRQCYHKRDTRRRHRDGASRLLT